MASFASGVAAAPVDSGLFGETAGAGAAGWAGAAGTALRCGVGAGTGIGGRVRGSTCFFAMGGGAGAGAGLERGALGAAGAGAGLSSCARMTGDWIAYGGALRSLARKIRPINAAWATATAATVQQVRMRAVGVAVDAVPARTLNGAFMTRTAVRWRLDVRNRMAGTSCAEDQKGDTKRRCETDKQFHLEVLQRTRAAAGWLRNWRAERKDKQAGQTAQCSGGLAIVKRDFHGMRGRRTLHTAAGFANAALRHDVAHRFLALATARGNAELELQFVERIDAFRDGGADLPVGN